MNNISIGQVATAANLRASAIRYYESEGLLPPAYRRSGRRVYDPTILDHLALIQLASHCGFSLDEIRTLLHGFAAGTSPRKRWRLLAKTKLAELNEKIAQISRMKQLLTAICRCKCLSIEECGIRARRSRLIKTCLAQRSQSASGASATYR
jgi:MerR family transcriptional regulator, redox-sensitive transcriptional activator SoxR